MLRALPPVDQQRVKMHVFAETIRSAPFLYWMAPFEAAVREVRSRSFRSSEETGRGDDPPFLPRKMATRETIRS